VLVGVQAGQDVDVRRKRDDVLRVRVVEDDAFARDPIQIRRCDPGVAGEAERIGAERVDRDENDIGSAGGKRLSLAAAGGSGSDQNEEKEKPNRGCATYRMDFRSSLTVSASFPFGST